MKVVELDAKQKPCPYCGAKKACPDFTCPRIKRVWHCEQDEAWEVTLRQTRTNEDDEPEGAA